ncbi:MAG: hypothetical protein ACLGHN_10200 [Bacteriovoracia bacterium]
MKLFLLLLFLAGCSGHREEPSDDYVLIEFASKLEEEYQKLSPPSEE